MHPNKLVLILAFPLVVALGWALRAALEPAPASAQPSTPVDAELASVEPAAASQKNSGDVAAPRKGESGKTQAGKNAGAKEQGGKHGAARQEGAPTKGEGKQAGGKDGKEGKTDGGDGKRDGAVPTKLPTVPLTLVLKDGESGPPVTDVRVHLSASAGGPRAEALARWAQSSIANADQRAAFGGEGLEVDADGTVVVDVPTDLALRIDIRGAGVGGENRATLLRALTKRMTRPREIDVQKTQVVPAEESKAASAAAPGKGDGKRSAAVTAVEEAPTEFFHVKLVAQADGSPLHGASVLFGKEELARSDEDGRFSLAFDTALSPVLQVAMPGYAPAIVQAKLGHHYPERALVVELRPGASIEARLLTTEGEAAQGTQVVLTTDMASVLGVGGSAPATGARLGELTWRATANRLGMVFFESLPTDAELRIGLLRPGQRDAELQTGVGAIPRSVTLAPGEVWKPEWRLPGRPEIAGRLVDQNGDPLPGEEIWLVAVAEGEPAIARYLRPEETPVERATTDAQGRFRFVDLDPHAWLVGLAPERPETSSEWQTALGCLAVPALVGDVNAPPQGEHLLIATRGLTIRGVVLGPGGYPAAGALVSALEENGHGALEVRAQGNGAFVLGPLSAGRFALLVSGCTDCGVERFGPFQAGSREVVLSLRAVRRYSGQVVTAAGDPRAALLAVFADGALRAQIETQSGLQPGRFEVALEPGLYDFVATTADGEVGSLRGVTLGAEALTSGFTLPVTRGGLVSTLYRGEHAWRHVTYFCDGRLFATGVLQAGVRRGQFLPAGRILVRAQTEIGEPKMELEFELSAGNKIEIEFAGTNLAPTSGQVAPPTPLESPTPAADGQGSSEEEEDGEPKEDGGGASDGSR